MGCAVAVLLREFAACDQIKIKDPVLAAEMFLNLVLRGTSECLALLGLATNPKVQEQRRWTAVELFLIDRYEHSPNPVLKMTS